MDPLPVEFHPLAIEEAREARRWYARRSPDVAEQFMDELDRAVEQVAAAPDRWPTYEHGTRVYQLQRFPYLLVYLRLGEALQIIAVAHGKRRPGYWKRRLTP